MDSATSKNIMIQKHASLEALKVLVVTWNVNAKIEQKSGIRKLLFSENNDRSDYPEIVAVGLQEVVELSTSNVVGSAIAGQCKDKVNKWQELIMETFQAENLVFDVVASMNLVGLWIVVFASHSRRSCISKVQASSFARGVGGVLGNKGAVYVRMDILDTSLCFVNAHFAAHREQVQKRNEDFHAILSHKCFPDYLATNVEQLFSTSTKSPQVVQLQQNITDMRKKIATFEAAARRDHHSHSHSHHDKALSSSASQSSASTQPFTASSSVNGSNNSNSSSSGGGSKYDSGALLPRHSADDHDVVIWLGDLNYRIVTGIDTSVVYDMIESKRSIYLAPYDQLNQERDKGAVFAHFHEGLLSFEPTYKYIPGKDCYDNRKEKKLRCPAWCDRVLWRIGKHSANTAQGFQSESDDTDDGSVADEGDDTDNNSSQAFPGSAKEQTVPELVPELVPGDSALEVELNLDSEMGAQGGATSGGKGGTSSEKKFLLQDSQSALNGKAGGTSSASPLYECQESVELMMYDRCDNVISDHKPVRAILNLKVKRVDWAAFELARIAEYRQQCNEQTPFSLKSCHFRNYLSMPAVTAAPGTVKLYSLVAPTGGAMVSGRASMSTATVNCSYFQLANNLPSHRVSFAISAASVPSWLVLSELSGTIDAQSSVRLQATTNQSEVNISALEMRDQNAVYAALPSLSRYVMNSGGVGGNFTAHSVELYAVLEVQLSAVAQQGSKEGLSADLRTKTVSVDGEEEGEERAPPRSLAIDTLLIPLICCAEHSV